MSINSSTALKKVLSATSSLSSRYKALDPATQKRVEAAAALALGAVSLQLGGWLAVGVVAGANLGFIGVQKLRTYCKTRNPEGELDCLKEERNQLTNKLASNQKKIDALKKSQEAEIQDRQKFIEKMQGIAPPKLASSPSSASSNDQHKKLSDDPFAQQ